MSNRTDDSDAMCETATYCSSTRQGPAMQGERQAAKAKRLGEIKVCAGILSERSTAAYRRTKEPLPKCLPGAEMSMSHSKFRRASASPDHEGLLRVGSVGSLA